MSWRESLPPLSRPLSVLCVSAHGDIAISSDGILYVADYNDRRIRKISSGQVSVLAGDGNFGTRDGAGDTAEFVDPYRIEVDAGGNVFVMDQADSRVRRITPAGIVSTYAGSGVAGFRDGNVSVALFARVWVVSLSTDKGIFISMTRTMGVSGRSVPAR